MILKISFDPEHVIKRGDGQILLKVRYYAEFANAAHLATVAGHTVEDFDTGNAKSAKSVMIGQRGGIVTE